MTIKRFKGLRSFNQIIRNAPIEMYALFCLLSAFLCVAVCAKHLHVVHFIGTAGCEGNNVIDLGRKWQQFFANVAFPSLERKKHNMSEGKVPVVYFMAPTCLHASSHRISYVTGIRFFLRLAKYERSARELTLRESPFFVCIRDTWIGSFLFTSL